MIYYEIELINILQSFIESQGYKVILEVPNMGQSTDLVGIKGDEIIAIEAKMSNWRRAIEQCQAHELVADFICIALAKKVIPENLMKIISSKGYGLIICNPHTKICQWIKNPNNNNNIWKPQRLEFEKKIRDINYAS